GGADGTLGDSRIGPWIRLALLAMTTATAVMDEVPMDMAPNSFDDRYWGCRDKMTAGCRDYGHELQQNSLFAQAWPQQWQRRVPCALSFLGPGHRHHGLHGANVIVQGVSHAVREAGILLDTETNFQLQSSAFPADTPWPPGTLGSAWPDGPVGQFTSTSLSKTVSEGYGTDTFFRCTCGWYTALLSPGQEVLIPPFETFDVTEMAGAGLALVLHLIVSIVCAWFKDRCQPRKEGPLGVVNMTPLSLSNYNFENHGLVRRRYGNINHSPLPE
uniref:NAD(P)(+)--arginine ADP-ribosyltransferase n=1 Tax=Malurus cyaneus samueli TaxID=2593467 RepID=A0A8C5U7J4_9PASS